MSFGATMMVKDLELQHPCYREHQKVWGDLDLLYRGGCYIQAQAERFLKKRPKELAEVYNHRVERFSYQNILGTALGWYQSAEFETPPDVTVRKGDVEVKDGGEFYAKFLKDCTRGGQSYVDFWRAVFIDLMLYRASFVLTDLPSRSAEEFKDKAEQKAAGALDPFVVRYDPLSVINWDVDPFGNLLWVVIQAPYEQRSFGTAPVMVDRWYVFNREEFATYEAERKGREKAIVASRTAAGKHALAEQKRVPVRMIQVPDALWLAHRAYLSILDHLNQDNSFSWALFMANLPVPVIKGHFQGDTAVSETAFIHLDTDGEFSFAEPSGTSFEHADKRCATMREEIHRQMYLQAQARSTAATPAAQSGYSKEMDMAPSQNVLSGFGDILREGMERVLVDVNDARGEDYTFSVLGFSFEEEEKRDAVSLVRDIQSLGIPSDTFNRECQKYVARTTFPDVRQETRTKIEAEIDAAPTLEEKQKQEAEAMRGRVGGALAKAAKRAA